MPRPPALRGYSRGNSSVATGVLFPWTDGRERSRGDLITVQMEGIGVRLLTCVARAALTAAGLLALLVLELDPARLAGATPVLARTLVFSDQARRLLLLQYQSYPTEFMGCMIGAVGMVHSQQWYLLQLRVLGAWWCLGSSALEPYLLLPYSLAQLKRDSLDRPLNRQ